MQHNEYRLLSVILSTNEGDYNLLVAFHEDYKEYYDKIMKSLNNWSNNKLFINVGNVNIKFTNLCNLIYTHTDIDDIDNYINVLEFQPD